MAGSLCSDDSELKPRGLRDIGSRTLQAMPRESGTTSRIRQCEESDSPEDVTIADPGEMMDHLPKYAQVPDTEDGLVMAEVTKLPRKGDEETPSNPDSRASGTAQ